MFQRSSLQRDEYIKKKRKRLFVRIGIFLFVFCALVGLSSYLAFRPNFRISNVKLSGGVLVTEKEVSEESLLFLSGKYFWLYPRNNSLLYPHDLLVKDLQEHFKRIDTINIDLEGFQTLNVQITERKPVALWCDSLDNAAKCYFMDSNSTIYSEAPQFSGNAYFKYYGLVDASSSPIGKEFMASSTEFRDLSDFVENTKKLEIKPLYLTAGNDGSFTLFLSGGGKIYFDNREPLSKKSENLAVLLRTPALTPRSGYDLPVDYIDLRFGNKLFYKMK